MLRTCTQAHLISNFLLDKQVALLYKLSLSISRATTPHLCCTFNSSSILLQMAPFQVGNSMLFLALSTLKTGGRNKQYYLISFSLQRLTKGKCVGLNVKEKPLQSYQMCCGCLVLSLSLETASCCKRNYCSSMTVVSKRVPVSTD